MEQVFTTKHNLMDANKSYYSKTLNIMDVNIKGYTVDACILYCFINYLLQTFMQEICNSFGTRTTRNHGAKQEVEEGNKHCYGKSNQNEYKKPNDCEQPSAVCHFSIMKNKSMCDQFL